ncbi:MAG: hypothetical protein RLZZ206_1523 [Cyanobacteriota bacterium]|jgi:hypothetical protein
MLASKLFANDLLASVRVQPAIGSRTPVVPIGVNLTRS